MWSTGALAQSFSPEIVSLGNFVRRMYEASPYEGVKVVEDYNTAYLTSLVQLEKVKYSDELIMNKVAAAKARSNVNKFLNGSQLTTDFIVKTEERKTDTTVTTEVITLDIIKEKSAGMVNAMETLVSFYATEEKFYVYVMFKEYDQ